MYSECSKSNCIVFGFSRSVNSTGHRIHCSYMYGSAHCSSVMIVLSIPVSSSISSFAFSDKSFSWSMNPAIPPKIFLYAYTLSDLLRRSISFSYLRNTMSIGARGAPV